MPLDPSDVLPNPPDQTARDMWVFIGRLEERARAARVVAQWKRYALHHAPNNHEAQALLSKAALEIMCALEEERGDAD